MELERQFQKWVVEELERAGCVVFNVHGHAMQQPGWPDLYFASPHLSGWLELKMRRNSLTTAQKLILKKLHQRGVYARVMRRHGPIIIEEWDGKACGVRSGGEGLLSFLRRVK